jgi:hypothetical protein
MRLLTLIAVLATLTPWAAAQRAASGGHASVPARAATPHFHSPASNFAFARNGHPSGFRRSSPYVSPYTSLPFPFFGDSFNLDDIYSNGYPVASQPPVFLLQAARSLAGSSDSVDPGKSHGNAREPALTQPLMIELQNGRYVRVSTSAADGDAHAFSSVPDIFQSNPAQPAKSAGRHSARVAANSITEPTAIPGTSLASEVHDLPPALLIFRDGHSEEVRDYTIADGMLYARGDYYTDGYWNKKIDLATLNVPETLQANGTRSVKFILPSSPNEVITRP